MLLLLIPHRSSAQADSTTLREISGRIVAADGGRPEGLWVSLRTPTVRDSVPVDRTGRFNLPLPPVGWEEDTVELRVHPGERGRGAYLPSLARMRAADLPGSHGFVLVPRRWTVAAGRFFGRSVEISMQRAFTLACGQCSSFFIHPTVFASVRRDVPVQSWPETQFPLRVAFDRDRSEETISARDSVGFWRVAEQMEMDFGRDLFRPARYEETLSEGDDGEPEDVILVWVDPMLPFAGVGFAVSEGGKIIHGVVRLKRSSMFTAPDGPSLVTHELVHALGFGHTCSWRSAAAEIRFCPEMRAESVTAEDVAYAEVLRAVQALQREHAARWGIEAALAGERARL